jgi:hypothetical protein
VAGERGANDIQRDIEQARVALAHAVDQIAYRTNPKRVRDNVVATLKAKAQTQQGKAVIGATGAVVLLLLIRRVRNR